jgi:predicted aspartyl protease
VTTIELLIEKDPEAYDEAWVFVNGDIEGHPYKFLLDTGAARSAIMQDEFNAQFESTEKSAGSGVFQASSDDLITVPALKIGPLECENMIVERMRGDAARRLNLVGMDFWQHHRCEFYFDQGKVVVDQPSANSGGLTLNDLQTDAKYHPYLDVEFENATGKAVWDTGASITVVDSNFIENHPEIFSLDGTSEGTDSTGATFETPMHWMKMSQIGGRSFPAVRVASVDFSPMNAHVDIPMDMILGYNSLSKANWLFDFPNKQWAYIG